MNLGWFYCNDPKFMDRQVSANRKNPKQPDTQKIAVIILKLDQNRFTTDVLAQKM